MLFFLFVALRVELDGTVVLGVLILLTVGIQRVRTLVIRTPTSAFAFSYSAHHLSLRGDLAIITRAAFKPAVDYQKIG